MEERESLRDKKRIVVKIGSSSLHHATGSLNLEKMERLVRILTDIRNQGKEVILVTSGAIAVGRRALGLTTKPKERSIKQACAAGGQARLMMVYQKLFAEYNQIAAQILITKNTMLNDISRRNAQNTFNELINMGVIPIVNENDTVSTDEMEFEDNDTFGDNDTLSAIVTALVGGDLLILLSDIDGLFTDDPHQNKDATLIPIVYEIGEELCNIAKGSTGGSLGTGGMATKVSAAKIATHSGADMIITNGENVRNISYVLEGRTVGTLFKAHKEQNFNLLDYIKTRQNPSEA